MPPVERLRRAAGVTWPAFAVSREGPFTVREGRGAGSRVSAATAEADCTACDLIHAEEAMERLGQRPLFQVWAGEAALDRTLAARGFAIKDPVVVLAAPVADLAAACDLPPLTFIECAAPVAVLAEIWGAGGIGPARLAVMANAPVPKVYLLGRHVDAPAAAAFVGMDGDVAILHALEVAREHCRQGVGRHMMIGAARWAARHGADTLAVLVTRANAAALALYRALGMVEADSYHYRIRRDDV